VSLEAISEVSTVKGVLPAEYGGVLGGQVNVLTRSGGNQFHGSCLKTFNRKPDRQRSLPGDQARIHVQPVRRFAGGPIKQNRVFIFGAYEGYRESRFRRVESNVLRSF
jgi:outer membrane receptor for ferrienterochelin and colicin